ncbi:hypothetical protein M9H77_16254 [Catharanthus roseus]|uniref:Uncharacterized protein n=1 Tax=Catharanthus roseus TaxID=4058 RepID=A0ACC0B019_CATRO|nr:hypothetical protein M9H77_16254 [Catharanthus roseus]
MDPLEESLYKKMLGDEDPNTFEEFLEPEEYIDLGHLFTTHRIFSSKDELVEWAEQIAMNAKTYLIITRYQRARIFDRRPYVTLACKHRGSVKKYKKPIVDDEKEEIPKKGVDQEQLQQTEQFMKSHVPPRNILQFFREQDVGCVVSSQKIYNVVAKIKRNRMQGRNTVEEVLRLSAEKDYIIFYRNGEDSDVLSNIVVAHPTSIAMIRTWPYVLIMDMTYKTNKKIGKSSGSGSGFGSGSGSGSNPSPRERGRPPRSGRSRGRGCSSGRSSLSTVLNLDLPPVPFPFKNTFQGIVSNFLFGDENHWVEIRKELAMIYSTVLTAGRWMLFAPIRGATGISSRYSLRWHGGSYRDIIATGNIPRILNPQVSAGELSSYPVSSEYPVVYSHSYNRSSEISALTSSLQAPSHQPGSLTQISVQIYKIGSASCEPLNRTHILQKWSRSRKYNVATLITEERPTQNVL